MAQILGHPIYVVTGVAITPCSSKKEADESIRRAATALRKHAAVDPNDGFDSSDEDVEGPGTNLDEIEDAASEEGQPNPDSAKSSIAEDVMRRRGSYGRFAQRWFSKSGWTLDQRRTLGLSVSSPPGSPINSTFGPSQSTKITLKEESKEQSRVTELLPKLLRSLQVFFGTSRSFYFSYDIDLTRSVSQNACTPGEDTPLHTCVDSQYFWNRHILQPLTSTGQDAISLPIIQGYVGQGSFVVDSDPPQKDEVASDSLEMSNMSLSGSLPASPRSGPVPESRDLRPSEKKYLITLISRRSTKRAGLRYLRRGINEDGFTANTVETEQILSAPNWDTPSTVYSFLQIRGSIPLFFTQTAYALKPVPVIQHSQETNYVACKRHFERLLQHYGTLQIVNLVEKHGIEEPIGTQYMKNIERFNEEKSEGHTIPFEWFDFHQACRGMKFENVTQLLIKLKGKLEELGSTTWKDGDITNKQRGVLRTNCMDCLDRTNVCQSSFAKYMLDNQLKQEGIDMSAQPDQEAAWFNTLWADNGDVVSKQYASTAAMKGDYTRTRKRNYRGALNDLGLSLARFYNGYAHHGCK